MIDDMEQRIEAILQSYMEEEVDLVSPGASAEILRNMHPRNHMVVMLKFTLDGEEHVRYADFSASEDRPFPYFTSTDPSPLHS